MLTEDEYLALCERVQRFSMGDPNVYADRDVLLVDLIRLLADWREWDRENRRMSNAGLRMAAELATRDALEQAAQGAPRDQAADDQGELAGGDEHDGQDQHE